MPVFSFPCYYISKPHSSSTDSIHIVFPQEFVAAEDTVWAVVENAHLHIILYECHPTDDEDVQFMIDNKRRKRVLQMVQIWMKWR